MNEIIILYKFNLFKKDNYFFKLNKNHKWKNFINKINLIFFYLNYNSFCLYFIQQNYSVKYKEKTLNIFFINTLIKNGLKLQSINNFNKIWEYFYSLFQKNVIQYEQKFQNYKIYLNISKLHKIFWNLNFFYQLFELQFHSIFCLKITTERKKLKMKKKITKYSTKLKYLVQLKRNRWIFKQIVNFSVWFDNKSWTGRLFYSLLTIILNPSNNFLINHKNKLYSILLKSKLLK